MLTRKRLLIASAMVLTLALIVGWFIRTHLDQPPSGVTHSAHQAIQRGMTLEDVERLVGQPAQRTWDYNDPAPDFPVTHTGRGAAWRSDDGQSLSILSVDLDQDGLVCGCTFVG